MTLENELKIAYQEFLVEILIHTTNWKYANINYETKGWIWPNYSLKS